MRAAVGVAGPDGPVAQRGPTGEAFAWASVTKLLTSLAVLVAVEEGTADLDAPAGPPGSTLRHLLSHASGLDRDQDRVVAAAGARRIYSNRGIEVAAATVEAAAGVGFAAYLDEAVLRPLDMSGTIVDGSYASGARGTLGDLLRLATELVAPTIVAPTTLTLAMSVAFPGLAGVLPGFGRQVPNDWGLGAEIRGHKSPHWTGVTNNPATFGHFGLSGAFVWVDPVAGIAGVGLADTDSGPWAKEAWPALADAVLERYGGGAG